MRPHIHVQRKLAKLRDEHGLTDNQLFAVCWYVRRTVVSNSLTAGPITRGQYDMWYKPR